MERPTDLNCKMVNQWLDNQPESVRGNNNEIAQDSIRICLMDEGENTKFQTKSTCTIQKKQK